MISYTDKFSLQLMMGRSTSHEEYLLSKRSKRRHISKRARLLVSRSKEIIANLSKKNVVLPSNDILEDSEHLASINNTATFNCDNNSHVNIIVPANIFRDINFETKSETECDNFEFSSKLQKWGASNNITKTALSGLLQILKTHKCFSEFPKDSRTLLHTPVSTPTTRIGSGSFHYFGITKHLSNILGQLPKNDQVVRLQFNIDGLPLFKSSSTQFWPILCWAIKTKSVFPVAIFCGDQKPQDLDEYLKQFVIEVGDLVKTGIYYNCKLYEVKIQNFVCDAPARAFICNIKNHTGYYGCGKCDIKGKYINHRVVFPKIFTNLRSDVSFRSLAQEKHHNGSTPLADLPVDMVQDFVYEYMHLICLGVTKKLLKLWVEGKRFGYRLRPKSIHAISKALEEVKSGFPIEFVRKYRSFLLYSGPVVLIDHLEEKYYHHFLVLSFATRLLLSPVPTPANIDYAENLLKYFVQEFKTLYGVENVSYNVHGLLHISADVRKHGNLEQFSAFRFESYLGKLKRLLKGAQNPIQQIHRRLAELDSAGIECDKNIPSIPFSGQIKRATINSTVICISFPNNILLLKTGQILVVKEIHSDSDKISFSGNLIKHSTSAFNHPCDSTLLHIFKVNLNKKSKEFCTFMETEIDSKCVPIKTVSHKSILFPLIHSSEGE